MPAKIGRRYELLTNKFMESIERTVAKSLLEIKAVMLRPDNPFTWASGWRSPIYCDNRRILSYPQLREQVCRWMADNINSRYPDADVISSENLSYT